MRLSNSFFLLNTAIITDKIDIYNFCNKQITSIYLEPLKLEIIYNLKALILDINKFTTFD